jgi:hypothetical protein
MRRSMVLMTGMGHGRRINKLGGMSACHLIASGLLHRREEVAGQQQKSAAGLRSSIGQKDTPIILGREDGGRVGVSCHENGC